MNKIVVIGNDHHNTLGVIRGLGERAVRPDVLLVSRRTSSFVGKSKYINKLLYIPNVSSLIDFMLDNYKTEEKKPVVICCSDPSIGIIDDNRNALTPYFILPGADEQGAISALMSKKQMADLAQEVGLMIPQSTYFIDTDNDISHIKLPCIIKPLESRKGTKNDIAICRTFEELKSYTDVHNLKNVQIQDYVEKDYEYQLIGCSTRNEIIIPGVSKILRPCKGSNTSFLHYRPLEKGFCELEKCEEFVRRTGYHGLFSLEFLRDKKGNDYFMEINFRNDGNGICVTAAGVSLPYIWYLDCIGADYSQERNKAIKSVFVMPDMAELKLLVTRQITLKEFVSDYRKTNRFMEYDKQDPKPFWALIRKELFHKAHL